MIVAIQGAINNELAMNNATVQLPAILKLLSVYIRTVSSYTDINILEDSC